jgi:hypothetical protein
MTSDSLFIIATIPLVTKIVHKYRYGAKDDWDLLFTCGAQRHTFIFGPKRGKPGGAASWFGVDANKGEKRI